MPPKADKLWGEHQVLHRCWSLQKVHVIEIQPKGPGNGEVAGLQYPNHSLPLIIPTAVASIHPT